MKIKIIEPVIKVPDKDIVEETEYLKRTLNSETVFQFEKIDRGFPSIETEAQGLINGAEILKTVYQCQQENCDGIFINCFDDPAVIAGREISKKPVLGPYLPTIKIASSLSSRVAVLTTDRYGILCEERKAKAYGFSDMITEIKAMDMGVLDLPDCDLAERIFDTCVKLEKKSIFAVVLGCTGMFFAAEQAQRKLAEVGSSVQIIEPFKTGIAFLENMIRLGYNNCIKSTDIKCDAECFK